MAINCSQITALLPGAGLALFMACSSEPRDADQLGQTFGAATTGGSSATTGGVGSGIGTSASASGTVTGTSIGTSGTSIGTSGTSLQTSGSTTGTTSVGSTTTGVGGAPSTTQASSTGAPSNCDGACAAGQQCQAGVCICQEGLSQCGDSCVDTSSDALNCGSCGNQCPAGQVCSMGTCSLGCGVAETECSESCVDLSINALNCGSCDNACAGTQTCNAGSCACPDGELWCASECVDQNTSSTHCGRCNNPCDGGQSCISGACACSEGQQFCDEQCRDIDEDPSHCGGCNLACSSGQTCVDGACECDGAQALCNGSCVDTQSDPANCGGCENSCQSGTCTNGSCIPVQGTGVIGWASVAGDGLDTTTGGQGGETVSVNSASALFSAASGNTPRIIQVSGNLNIAELDVGSNKTIVGVAGGATINGGININDESNVIIQNLYINARNSDAGEDGIHVQSSHHIWVDHVEIWDAPDGNMDINDGSNWISVSWSIFRYSNNPPDNNHRFSNLIGSSDSNQQDAGRNKVTLHHNWWSDRVHERMPRVRFGQVHVFNNYYSAAGNNYCIRAGYQADIRVENNFFEGVDTPHEIDGSGAVISESGSSYVNTSGDQDRSGTAFSPAYPYNLDPPDAARTAVIATAGPQ